MGTYNQYRRRCGNKSFQRNIPVSLANIAILNMTRALSDAVSKDGILVNTICPGLTNTQRARDVQQASADQAGIDVEELLQELGNELPAGRIAEPEEIADVVAFWHQSRVRIYSAVLYTWTAGKAGDTVGLSVIIPTLPNRCPPYRMYLQLRTTTYHKIGCPPDLINLRSGLVRISGTGRLLILSGTS